MHAYLWTVGSRNKSLRISDCCKATTKYKKLLGVCQLTAVHKMRSSVLSRQSWWFRRQSLSKLTTSKEKKRKEKKRKEKKRKEKKRKEKKRKEKKRKEKKRKEKTTPFGVNWEVKYCTGLPIYKQTVMLSFVVTVDVQCQGNLEPVSSVTR